MPRLQYNNPNVEFVINRSTDPQTAPVVTVHFGKSRLEEYYNISRRLNGKTYAFIGNQQSKTIEIPPKYQNEDVCKLVFEAKP